jgi:polyphosphate kinase
MSEIDLRDTKYYENRELSWLEFNQRVLDEAMNTENPLLERIKFLSIVTSNLDEFFMVRVASLKEQVSVGYDKEDFSGLNAQQLLRLISARAHKMIEDQAFHYKNVLVPLLKDSGIIIIPVSEFTEEQSNYIEEYFTDIVYPVLTPLAVDSSRPFPLILNKSLNIATLLQKDGNQEFATVQVPAVLPRFIKVPNNSEGEMFVLLEDVIMQHIQTLFIGYEVICTAPYRITRNADLTIDEEEAEDLLLEIEKSIKKRKWGEALRLEVVNDMDERLVNILKDALNIHARNIYYIDGALDLTFLMKLYSIKGYDHLKYEDYSPKVPQDLLGEDDIFDTAKKKDIFLSHPFESFGPVVNLITKAAKDNRVLAIKQTLYRVSGQSPIIKALALAAEAGKQVTVLVELKARFDEENNIQWARRLEQAGCHVIYGLVGLKTHSKVTLIVRKEDDGIIRYVHLGTGNYNDITAKFYTDMGLITCNEKIGADVSAVFNTLSGYSEPPRLHKLTMAPTGLRQKFIQLINREIEYANEGMEAKIIIKMNSLCDGPMIRALYEASIAGVEIELIIRGICCLIPGIEGVSENITVRSIVGKYLEHSRIFYFYNNGEEEIYLSSADMMPRNLNRRVELLFPIEDEAIKQRLKGILEILLKDVVKAKIKDENCAYHNIERSDMEIINSQNKFQQMAIKIEDNYFNSTDRDLFVPKTSHNFEV